MNPVAKYLAFTVAVIAILLGCVFFGAVLQEKVCQSKIASLKNELDEEAKAQREASQAIEAKQEAATSQSTERLDQKQVESQKEIVYVDKQVIQYRNRWRDRTCQRPADWVRIYNSSLFGSGHAVPEASAARSASAGAGL